MANSKRDLAKAKDDELLLRFGDLLNEYEPRIRTEASQDAGLTVTLHFDAGRIDKTRMRALAALVADQTA